MRRVLVPLDGSERGDLILSFLDRMLPELRAGELVVLRVLTESSSKEVARARLEETARRLGSAGHRAIPLLVAGADPAAEVAKVARLIDPWLVALSTHGEGASQAPRGSVAAKVIERCPAPLLLVGRQALPLDPGPGFARVLVALDGSPDQQDVLPLVAELARPSDAEVLLAHTPGVDPAPARTRLVSDGVVRTRTLEAKGDLARALLDVAAHEAVDLVAIGARPRGGEGLGAVAREVAQRCDCPLLLVR
jgi:nucleotide-binding universal stress UspA family protein